MLKKSGIDCHADDRILIYSSLSALNYIIFNAKKTMSIKFGTPITQQDKVRHLGVIAHINLSDLPECKIKCSTFTGSVNKLFYTYKGLNHDTMCQLLGGY